MAVAGVALLTAGAQAANVNWVGGTSSDFNTATNWSGNALPTQYTFPNGSATDIANFDGTISSNKTVNLSANYGLYGLSFQDSGWTLGTGSNTLSVSYKPSQASGHSIASYATSGTNTINGALALGNFDNNYFPDVYVASGGTLRINAALSSVADKVSGNANGGLSITGPGTVELNTTGSYGIGGLRISAGTVKLFAETAGGVTGNGTGGLGTNNNVALSLTGGKLDLNGAANLGAGSFSLATGAEVTNSSATARTLSTRANGSAPLLAGTISGNLLLNIGSNASEITTISGTNSYTGTTTLSSSSGGSAVNVVQVSTNALSGQNGAFGNATSAVILGSSANGVSLLTNGTVEIGRDIQMTSQGTGNYTIGSTSLTGSGKFSGQITIGTNATAGATQYLTLNATTAAPVTVSGNIIESAAVSLGGVKKLGAGTAILSGTGNTYIGATLVNAGTLLVNGKTVAASAFTVGGTGTTDTPTLGGGVGSGGTSNPNSASRAYYTPSATIGNIGGSVTINGAGTGTAGHLAAGNSVGTLSVGSLVLSTGSIADIEFNATANDFTAVAGALTINSGVNVNLLAEGTTNAFATAGLYDLFSYASLANTFDASAFTVANANSNFTYTFGNDTANKLITLTIAPVPEPTTLGVAAIGAMAILGRRRAIRTRC